MTPEIKKSIDKFLDDKIGDFKMLARRVGTIAAEDSTLSGYELGRLTTANDAADAAMAVKAAIVQAGEDDLRLIRNLQGLMSAALRQKECSAVRVAVFNEVLSVLRGEAGLV